MKTPEAIFMVRYRVNKNDFECGPYADLDQATSILIDLLPDLASVKSKKFKGSKYIYKAEVHECILGNDGEWVTISIPITENLCRKTKH